MTNEDILGLIALSISISSGVAYIVSTARGKTKPHAFTWAIWSVIQGIIFVAQWGHDAGAGAWTVGANSIGCFSIFVLSLFKGEKNITRSDWVSFLCALAIIPFWHLTENAVLAVVLATVIDAFAYYPTIRKTWMKPQEENLFMYASSDVLWILALMAMHEYSTVNLVYPLFCMIANSALTLMIVLRRRRQQMT